MMKKYFLSLKIGVSIIASLFMIGVALAQTTNISYPIEELGNCTNKTECKTYCDNPKNSEACLDYAVKNNLMTQEEALLARKVMSGELNGPGGCKTKDECEDYCNDMAHIEQCVSFAEANNLMTSEELAEAKKIAAAIRQGIQPPACKSKSECDNYCSEASHMEECMNFAVQAGFMSAEEQADAQKMLAALKNGVKPPACRGKTECEQYCSLEENMDECADFAVAAGFMDQKQYEMIKKTKGRGPGGCKGKEECEAFCNNSANQQTCVQFGIDNGLMSEEEIRRMEESKKQFQKALEDASPQVRECLTGILGDLSAAAPTPQSGQALHDCNDKFAPRPGTGPGGCTSREECDSYCRANPSKCNNPSGGSSEEQQGSSFSQPNPANTDMQRGGPGGCQSEEECRAYCTQNPNECGGPRPEGEGVPQSGENQEFPSEGSYPPPGNYFPQSGEVSPEGNYPPPSVSSPSPTENFPANEYEAQSPDDAGSPNFRTPPLDSFIPPAEIPPPPTENVPPPTEAPEPTSYWPQPEDMIGLVLRLFVIPK